MKEDILKILSQKEMSVDELERKTKDEKLTLVLKDMENSGLIFVKKNQNYSITLLGKFLSLGLKDVYESIVKRKDLFDFFRMRIPSAIPDEFLAKFKVCEDFQIIGKPDLIGKQKEITDKALSMQPYVEKELCVSAPIMFKPGMLHMLGVLRKKPKVRVIVPGEEYEKHTIFYGVSEKVANFESRAIEEECQYIGLLYIDGKCCFFGFRDLEDNPGWDAVISTKDKECIEWVKENFDYMWDNLAKEP